MRSRNRNTVMLLAFGSLILGTGFFHKFYVSLTELRFNSESSRFEVSIRIFPDDLERALLELYSTETHLATSLEPPEADSLLETYLLLNFTLDADGESVPFTYLGKEPESDVIWCYLESDPVRSPHLLRIRNSILIEAFEDQVNIVQVYSGDWNRGMLLNGKTPEDELKIGD